MVLKKVVFQKDWYDRLISKTDEKGLLLSKFKELLTKKGYKSCLEIGLGTSPFFANKLHIFFEDYTIIEKEKHNGNLPKNVKIIQSNWEDAKISKKFDVILASHVVYYFDNKKKAITKMINSLTEGGILILVVNGNDTDYGSLKRKFSELIREKYEFTYDNLKALIRNENYIEHTVHSTISFEDSEDLFQTLKLSFDTYPEEYLKLKRQIVEYFDKNIRGNQFKINQKIIVINNKKSEWDDLIKHSDYEINVEGMNILVKDGVFTPDPKITNTSLMIIKHLPNVRNLDVLDIGCGTGIISIYCTLKGARNVLAIDNSNEALENTRINLKKNKINNRIKVIKSNLFENVSGKFDYIFANLPILDEVWNLDISTTNTIQKFILECKKYIKKGGKVYFTWASFSDIEPIKSFCSKLNYSYKQISENKSGIIWYLIELSF